MIFFCFVSSFAVIFDTENPSPLVGDWQDAVRSNGLVKIPLANPHGHSWFANIQLGTPAQNLYCVIENNHALSFVFSNDCTNCPRARGFEPERSGTYLTHHTQTEVVHDDGFAVVGFMAADNMCIGMAGN